MAVNFDHGINPDGPRRPTDHHAEDRAALRANPGARGLLWQDTVENDPVIRRRRLMAAVQRLRSQFPVSQGFRVRQHTDGANVYVFATYHPDLDTSKE